MRSSLPFFKVFPPPKFMLMPHAGLDISDDGAHFIAYSGFGDSRRIASFGSAPFPDGLFVGGDIKDEKEFVSRISEFVTKNGLHAVKVSIPEEKAYLFQTDVPSTEQRAIEQNIEFKLEENVPLSAPDAVFYFDLLPRSVTGGSLRASVSVVPRTYIERYTRLLASAGLEPISFETVPKAMARAIISGQTDATRLIVHLMDKKTGIYIVSGNVIHFTFTAQWGTESLGTGRFPTDELRKEIARIRSYWLSHGNGMTIAEAVLVGTKAVALESEIVSAVGDGTLSFVPANVWSNAIDIDDYVPPISMAQSLGYAVAAGLAFETPRNL